MKPTSYKRFLISSIFIVFFSNCTLSQVYSPSVNLAAALLTMQKVQLLNRVNFVAVKINTDQAEYIKGELFQFDVTVTNHNANPITLQNPVQHHQLNVKHLEDNFEFTANSLGPVHIWNRELLPGKTHSFSITPEFFTTYTKEGLQRHLVPGYYWKEGTYQVELILFGDDKQYKSNIYEFTIKPVPEALAASFEILQHKKRAVIAPTVKDMINVFLDEQHTFYNYELFFQLSLYSSKSFKIERITDLPGDLQTALKLLILENPNKHHIIQYIKDIKHVIKNSKGLKLVTANKAFLAEIADSVDALRAKEPKKYKKLLQVLKGEQEKVFKN